MRYTKKRVYSWSPDIAYAVGLLASDGCLQKDRRHIDLTSVEIKQLENFCKAISKDLRITKKTTTNLTPAWRVQFSDVALYDFLINAGITPAKSKTIGFLSIPDELFADFFRGVFDGDGTVYGYWDRRWKSSHMFYVEIASASLDFIMFLRGKCMAIAGVSPGSIRDYKGMYVLRFAKRDSTKLYGFMYYRDDVIALSRKRIKLRSFTELSTDVILR